MNTFENPWFTCDGSGQRPVHEAGPGEVVAGISRRGVLMGLAMGAVSWMAPASALGQLTVRPNHDGHVLVSVFLRGGLDGLSAVVPYSNDDYHRARPTLRLRPPTDPDSASRVIPIDDRFGLNPALGALQPLLESGCLTLVHAVGSGDQTRSHFEAMNAMERGLHEPGKGDASGWLARYLQHSPAPAGSPLRAVTFGSVLPDSLRGASGAITLGSLADFRLVAQDEERLREQLRALYSSYTDPMAEAGKATLEVLASIRKLDPARALHPESAYPDTGFGQGLRMVAFLVKARVGVEVASVDMGGWDTHVAQGTTSGWLPTLLRELGDSLAAFWADLGTESNRVTVIVQTEFGRRVHENAGLGTDHGRGSAMFLLGHGMKGGAVLGDWPGLGRGQLESGDLRVSNDYRQVLTEVLVRKAGISEVEGVFEGLVYRPIGLFA